MFEDTRRFLGITPRRDAARLLDATLTPVAKGADAIIWLGRSLMRGRKQRLLPCDSSDGHERFLAALMHYRIAENDLPASIRATHTAFWLRVGIATALLAFLGHLLASKLWAGALLAAALITLMAGQAVSAALANFQFRQRSLVSVRDFLKSSDCLPRRKGGIT